MTSASLPASDNGSTGVAGSADAVRPADHAGSLVQPDTRIRLWDDGNVVVEHVTGVVPGNRLVVTFSHYGSNDLNAAGYAEQFWRSRGFDVLAVKTAQNDWFQTLSLEKVASLCAGLPIYTAIVTYGSSMGGYAALYFADAVGAELAIALSPQYSVDPAIMPNEDRWTVDASRIAFTHVPLGEVLQTGDARLVVIYDPHNNDRLHAEAMEGARHRLVPLIVRYGGHPVSITLHEIGALEAIIFELLEGKTPDIRATMRADRARSAQYLFFLGLACSARGHVRWADRLLTQAAARDPRPEILLEHSRLLARRHDPKGALALLETGLERMAPDAHLLAYHAHLKDLCGDAAGAMASFDRAILREPDFTGFYIAERAVLHRIIHQQSRKLDLLETIASKLTAERDLKLGPVPGHYGVREILGFTILPLLVAGIAVTAARMMGIL